MELKKMIIGEPMPDKDDPKYRKQYEHAVEAGKKFARFARLDQLAAKIQDYAQNHQRRFLGIVFGFVFFCFALNVYRIIVVLCHDRDNVSAIQRQERMIKQRHNKIIQTIGTHE